MNLDLYSQLFKFPSYKKKSLNERGRGDVGGGSVGEPKSPSKSKKDATLRHNHGSGKTMSSPPTRLPGFPCESSPKPARNSFFPDNETGLGGQPPVPRVFTWHEGENGPRPINQPSPSWSPIYKDEDGAAEGLLGKYNGPLIVSSPPPFFGEEDENGYNFVSSPAYNSSPATELSSNLALSEISDLLEALNSNECGGFDTPNYNQGNRAFGSEPSNSLNGSGWRSPDTLAFPACLDMEQTLEYITALENIRSMDGSLTHIQQLLTLLRHHLMFLTGTAQSSRRSSTPPMTNKSGKKDSLDRAAMFHRESAAICKPSFTWSGQLPPRIHRNSNYSCKVFVGGIPWDLTDAALQQIFKPYGNIIVQWPGNQNDPNRPKGFTYIIFETEKQVKSLIANCTQDYSRGGEFYHRVVPKGTKGKVKDAQIIPWASCDSNFVKCQTAKLDSKLTIFVGAIHGVVNAEGLATVMDDLFDGVIYAGIDLDKFKYPMGSGRVVFGNEKSFLRAVSAAFVEIKAGKVNKKVQVDPYLEDAPCSMCNLQQGPYFCRDFACFRYFCKSCFKADHKGDRRNHKPLTRNEKEQQRVSTSALCSPEPRGNRGMNRPSGTGMNRMANMWNKPGTHNGHNNGNKAFKVSGPRC